MDARGADPGSRIYWVVTNVTVGEIYEAAQVLAAWTDGQPGLPVVGALREQYWRNRIGQVILGARHGVVFDKRTEMPSGTGFVTSSIEGVCIIEQDETERDRASVTMVGTPEVRAILRDQAEKWGAANHKQLGNWEVRKTWVPL